MLERIKREPALVSGLVSAIILLVVAFGFTLTPEQIGGIMAVVVAGLALFTRSQVVPANAVTAYQTIQGETVTGKAAPPEGEPAAVVTNGDDYAGLDIPDHPNELGAYDTGSLLFALACIVVIICGAIFIIRAL